MRVLNASVLLFLLTVSPIAQATIHLEGLVTDSDGAVIPTASVVIVGDGRTQRTETGDEGRFSFDIAPGRHDLEVSLLGFVSIRLLNMDIPKQPEEPLLIILPRLVLNRHPAVSYTSESVKAPPLDLAFLPDDSMQLGGAVSGRLILENTSERVIEMPTNYDPAEETRNPDHLGLRISMRIPNQDAGFFRYYFCTPGKDCRDLAPGEMMAFPVGLSRSKQSAKGPGFDEPGIWHITCSLTLAMPGVAERVTEPLTASFAIAVKVP